MKNEHQESNEYKESLEGLKGRRVYLLSPVRKVTKEQAKVIAEHAKKLEDAGAILFNPIKDAPQQDTTGYNIVMSELNFLHEAAKNGGRVDVLWNAGGDPSEGSRVDVGMALALGLELNLVEVFNADNPTGPQSCLRIISGKEAEAVNETINNIRNCDQVYVEWDMMMVCPRQEWQRVYLGIALGLMIQNPHIKLILEKVTGDDPPEKKSYVKVMREIEDRQSKNG